jgi:hypothetical protein
LKIRSLQGGASGFDSVATRVDNGDFLRIVRDLRRVHSHVAALAYPVLEHAAENDHRDAEPAPVPATRLSAEIGRAGDSGDRD